MTMEDDVINTDLNVENGIQLGTWVRQHDLHYKRQAK